MVFVVRNETAHVEVDAQKGESRMFEKFFNYNVCCIHVL